jgi:hypothetical protein
LTGSIEHIEERDLVVDHALLAVRILDGLSKASKGKGRQAG